jgi:hypothetical protein
MPCTTAPAITACGNVRVGVKAVVADGADLVVRVTPAADGDLEGVAGLARRLRTELRYLDVELVEPVTEDTAPEGGEGPGQSGRCGDTVKVTGATAQQKERLINVWLARHAPGPLSCPGPRLALVVATTSYADAGSTGFWLAAARMIWS